MNKPLIRAAAVINIAVASLIFIACSGEDGKDGASCRTEAAPGGTNLICGNSAPIFIAEGGGGGGCVTTVFADPIPGGVILACAGQDPVRIYNGSAGAGGPDGACQVTPAEVPTPPAGTVLQGDKLIKIACSDGRSASIVVCPSGATGLLVNTENQVGRCTAAGTIVRTEESILLCGTETFDPKKQFCQRTFAANSTPSAKDSGFFVTYSAATGLAARSYPGDSAGIIDPESAYNLAGKQPGVNNKVLPLCGANVEDKSADIVKRHLGNNSSSGSNSLPVESSTAHVYNALQYCARNLIIKVGSETPGLNTGNISAKKGDRNVIGGSNDINAAAPYTAAWFVLPEGSCVADIQTAAKSDEKDLKVNGFTFSGTLSPTVVSSSCTFVQATTIGTPPYTACPSGFLFSLDDATCVESSDCIYYSTVDNTCLVGKQPATLFGKNEYDSAYVTGTKGTLTSTTNPDGTLDWKASGYTASFNKAGDIISAGIYRTKLGSRDGRGTSPVTLERDGNMWSRPCQTLTATRLGFYAVNDPYLTNKKWKDTWIASGTGGSSSDVPIEPPTCAGTNLNGTNVAAIPFDDAFTCIQGELSVYSSRTATTNDGNNWNRPIYCVQTGWTQGAAQGCYISGSSILDAITCGDVSKSENYLGIGITLNTSGGTAVSSTGSLWNENTGTCEIYGPTEQNCGTIAKAVISRSTRVVAVVGAASTLAGANASSLSGAWNDGTAMSGYTVVGGAVSSVTNGGCVVNYNPELLPGSTVNRYPDVITACRGISKGRQIGSQEFNLKGTHITNGTTDKCVVTADVDLSTTCNQIDLLRAATYDPSNTETVDVTAEWKDK